MSAVPSTNRTVAGPERRVAVNSGLLLAAYGLQAAVSVVLVGLVARYLGQAGLGRYGYAISFIELFVPLIDLGMNRILVRETARSLDQAGRLASVFWTMRLLPSAGVLALVALLAARGGDPVLWWAVVVYGLAQVLFLLADVYNAVFHGFQRMEYQFWGVSLSQVLLLIFTIAVIRLDAGLVALFGARLVANALKLLYAWWVSSRLQARARFLPGVLRRTPDTTLAWQMLRESLPLGISLVLRSYIWRGSLVLMVLWLGQAQGDLANGLLYGPLRVVQQMRIVPSSFTAALLPVFSNRATNRLAEFDAAFAKSIKLLAALALLVALGFFALADPVVFLLLGAGIDQGSATQVLRVMGWIVLLTFPSRLYGITLVAQGRQRLETWGLGLGLGLGFLVARWGIPRFQALGASYAILAAEGVFFVIGTAAMWRHFHWRRLAPSLSKIILSCAAAGLVFHGGHRLWPEVVALPGLAQTWSSLLELAMAGGLGLLAFAAALWLLRAFDDDELDALRAMFRLRPRR